MFLKMLGPACYWSVVRFPVVGFIPRLKPWVFALHFLYIRRAPSVDVNDPSTSTDTSGIHHVTAIASDPQRNVDCSTDVLGRSDSERGREGVGTVHHVAVRAPATSPSRSWGRASNGRRGWRGTAR